MSNQKQEIIRNLQPMFKQAEEQGLWFRNSLYDLVFSPSDLRKAHERDSFLWGPINWTLVSPEGKTSYYGEVYEKESQPVLNNFSTIDAVTKVMQEKRVNRDFFTEKEFQEFIEKLDGKRNWKDARDYIDLIKKQKSRDLDFSIICMVVGQHLQRKDVAYDEAYPKAVEIEDAWYSPRANGYDYVSNFAWDYLKGMV